MVIPKVTVGICVKNGAVSIGEAIDSVLSQDYPHAFMNILVVDGGSKDQTVQIIKEHLSISDIPFQVFLSHSKGLGFDRNIVIANSNADYIVWVDGDMLVPKNFVRALVEFMENNPKLGISKGKQALEPCRNVVSTLESYSRAAGRMVNYESRKGRGKTIGTAGAIYRMSAIKQVGGFDEAIRGYGEDWDVELRIRKAGWLMQTMNVTYLDYERLGITWKELWSRYWRRGYDTHYFLHKNGRLIKHSRMFPPASFLNGLIQARKLFGLTRQKIVFFLPLQFLFKMTAWYVGFTESHIASYQPRSNPDHLSKKF